MSKNNKNWRNGILPISKENIEKGIEEFVEKFYRKIKQKGNLSFNSTLECMGKIEEERFEILTDLHDRNLEGFQEELLDLAIVCVAGYMSSKIWEKV